MNAQNRWPHVNRLRSCMSLLINIAALSVLMTGLSGLAMTGIANANAPAQVCDLGSDSACLNRKQNCTSQSGTCQIISYNNDDDNNEYFDGQLINACGGGSVVTQTCPFTNGSGMDTDNAGNQILQIVAYNTSGQSIGCVGDDGSGLAVLYGCNSVSNGTGGGQGTMWVYNNGSGFGSHMIGYNDFANRYESNKFYAGGLSYPVILTSLVRGNQLVTTGTNGTYQWGIYHP